MRKLLLITAVLFSLQRHRKQNGQTDNVGSDHHLAAPPFSLRPETALAITPRISSAKAAR